MTIGIGVFGKVPSYPEFVTIGSRSSTDRSFEKWLEMANDQLARANVTLSTTPIGFCYRDEDAGSLLIGVLVGSRDKVGRTFPLSVYCEFGIVLGETRISLLSEAFRPALTQLSMLALTAVETTPDSLKAAVKRVERPGATAIKNGLAASEQALRTVPLQQVLSRIFAKTEDRAYGLRTLIKAVAQSRRDGPSRPTSLDVTVTSDVELSFWLAAVESQLPAAHGPVSALWEVSTQRALLIPGVPDSKILVALASPHAQSAKVWRTETSSEESRKAAWAKLDDSLERLLESPGDAPIQALLDMIRVP